MLQLGQLGLEARMLATALHNYILVEFLEPDVSSAPIVICPNLEQVLDFQVFGIAIAMVGEEAKPVLTFFTSITVIMMRITQWIIAIAPIGVLFLVRVTIDRIAR